MSEGAQATLTAEGDCDCGNVDEVGEFDARAHTSSRFTLLETHAHSLMSARRWLAGQTDATYYFNFS